MSKRTLQTQLQPSSRRRIRGNSENHQDVSVENISQLASQSKAHMFRKDRFLLLTQRRALSQEVDNSIPVIPQALSYRRTETMYGLREEQFVADRQLLSVHRLLRCGFGWQKCASG